MSQARNLVNGYLDKLGGKLGLDDLALDDEGHCGLEIDDPAVQVNLEILPDEQGLVVHADMAEYEAGSEGNLFGPLLQANLYGIQTGGAAFGVDAERHAVVLSTSRTIPELTSYVVFESLVEDFLDVAADWVERLARM